MRRPARIVLTASVVPAVLLGLAACTQPAPLPLSGSTSPAASPSPSASARQLSVQSIAGRALQQVGSGTVVAVEDESAGTVWDVRVVQEDGSVQELHLSPSGRVLAGPSSDTTDADQQSTNRAMVAATSVSLAGAVDRMTAAVPKGRVTAVQLSQYEDRGGLAGRCHQRGRGAAGRPDRRGQRLGPAEPHRRPAGVRRLLSIMRA